MVAYVSFHLFKSLVGFCRGWAYSRKSPLLYSLFLHLSQIFLEFVRILCVILSYQFPRAGVAVTSLPSIYSTLLFRIFRLC